MAPRSLGIRLQDCGGVVGGPWDDRQVTRDATDQSEASKNDGQVNAQNYIVGSAFSPY